MFALSTSRDVMRSQKRLQNRLVHIFSKPSRSFHQMRFKIFTTLLTLALVSGAVVAAYAQDEDEAVRGSFLTSRTKPSTSSGNSSASGAIAATANLAGNQTGDKPTSNRPTSGRSTRNNSGRTTTSASVSVKGSSGKTTTSVKGNATLSAYSPSAIGLGYTL